MFATIGTAAGEQAQQLADDTEHARGEHDTPSASESDSAVEVIQATRDPDPELEVSLGRQESDGLQRWWELVARMGKFLTE